MDQQDYLDRLKELGEQHRKDVQALQRQYALAHSPYKVGDLFEDHAGKIRITKVGLWMSVSKRFPSCVYTGLVLKKDGTPTKKGEVRDAWQVNDITAEKESFT